MYILNTYFYVYLVKENNLRPLLKPLFYLGTCFLHFVLFCFRLMQFEWKLLLKKNHILSFDFCTLFIFQYQYFLVYALFRLRLIFIMWHFQYEYHHLNTVLILNCVFHVASYQWTLKAYFRIMHFFNLNRNYYLTSTIVHQLNKEE